MVPACFPSSPESQFLMAMGDKEQYSGQWVAILGSKVIAHGKAIDKVYAEAAKISKGKTPLFVNISDKNRAGLDSVAIGFGSRAQSPPGLPHQIWNGITSRFLPLRPHRPPTRLSSPRPDPTATSQAATRKDLHAYHCNQPDPQSPRRGMNIGIEPHRPLLPACRKTTDGLAAYHTACAPDGTLAAPAPASSHPPRKTHT